MEATSQLLIQCISTPLPCRDFSLLPGLESPLGLYKDLILLIYPSTYYLGERKIEPSVGGASASLSEMVRYQFSLEKERPFCQQRRSRSLQNHTVKQHQDHLFSSPCHGSTLPWQAPCLTVSLRY